MKVALYELAASQLDIVATVKRSYYDLYFGERAEACSSRTAGSPRISCDWSASGTRARPRRRPTCSGPRWRSDIDRELERPGSRSPNPGRNRPPDPREPRVGLEGPSRGSRRDRPGRGGTALRIAVPGRPELKGRLAAIARDEKGIELARKRYYPNVTPGLVYQDMQKTNAVTPRTASGVPNVGLFVGFNLPVYRKKLAAGVCEAQARASADAALFESERDQTRAT